MNQIFESTYMSKNGEDNNARTPKRDQVEEAIKQLNSRRDNNLPKGFIVPIKI